MNKVTIPFVKTQALGNDFILVEQTPKIPADHSELGKRICHRYFGVGGDGLILWTPSGDSFKLRIINMDGSEAECSGNGLRCLAAYLIESGRWPQEEIRLQTVSGLYTLRRTGKQYEADMGEPHLTPKEIPFLPPSPMERVVNLPMTVDGNHVAITACSTGNPH
jgi:diaminopimelate epimerase